VAGIFLLVSTTVNRDYYHATDSIGICGQTKGFKSPPIRKQHFFIALVRAMHAMSTFYSMGHLQTALDFCMRQHYKFSIVGAE
jgi:hypothetical protein